MNTTYSILSNLAFTSTRTLMSVRVRVRACACACVRKCRLLLFPIR